MKKQIKELKEEIVAVLAIGGGFWLWLAPPIGEHPKVFTGFVTVLVLAATFGVRVALHIWASKPWVTSAVYGLALLGLILAMIGFYVYVPARSSLVFDYEVGVGRSVEIIRGTEYHPHVAEIKRSSTLTDEDLLGDAGGADARDLIWTPESIIEAERKLTFWYLFTALSTFLSTMFFLEILRMKTQKKR